MKVVLMTLPGEGEVRDFTTPTFYRRTVRHMHLGIIHVAAGISPQHEVKLLDPSDLTIDQTLDEVARLQPDVLGISTVTFRAWAMKEVIRRAPAPIVIVGGPHTTHYGQETLTLGAFAVFNGDGDRGFGQWLDSGIPRGLFSDYITDLDSLPLPPYYLLPLEAYGVVEDKAPNTLLKEVGLRLPMVTSRGCLFLCTFCNVPRSYRSFSPQRVAQSMMHAASFGATSLHLVDDMFGLHRKWLLDTCAEIQRIGVPVPWSARTRPNRSEAEVRALAEAGCQRLHVGIEALDGDILQWMKKGTTVEAIRRFCRSCAECGIELLAYFIMGTPVETEEYRRRLPGMIRELGIKYPYFNILYPIHQSDYYVSLLKDGTYKEDLWGAFARDPVKDFEMPLPRPRSLQEELEATVAGYIGEFYPNG